MSRFGPNMALLAIGTVTAEFAHFFESIALVYVEKSYTGTQNVNFLIFPSRTRFFDRLSKTVLGHKTAPEQ